MTISVKIGALDTLEQVASSLEALPMDVVVKAWHEHAQELRDIEVLRVFGRTQERAYDTGALSESVSGRAYTDPGMDTLATIFFVSGPQMEQWNRTYARFNEGPPIGVTSPTIDGPRHMLYDMQTEDAPLIQQWAVEVGQAAVDEYAASISGGLVP